MFSIAHLKNISLNQLIFLVMLFVGYSLSTYPAHALSYDDIIEKNQISIAVYRDFPPFSYRSEGKLVGIDVEIAHHIATQLGVRLRLIEQTADENVDDDLRNAIWKGHYLGGAVADVMLHIPYDRVLAQRNNLAVLFGPYMKEEIVLARHRKTLGSDATLALFRFEKIAVELDSLADLYLSGAFGGTIRPNILHFHTQDEAGEATLTAKAKGTMGPRSQVEHSLLRAATEYDVGTVPTPGLVKANWLIGAAVKSTYRQLGYAVEDIIANLVQTGEIANIYAKHRITYRAPSIDHYSQSNQ